MEENGRRSGIGRSRSPSLQHSTLVHWHYSLLRSPGASRTWMARSDLSRPCQTFSVSGSGLAGVRMRADGASRTDDGRPDVGRPVGWRPHHVPVALGSGMCGAGRYPLPGRLRRPAFPGEDRQVSDMDDDHGGGGEAFPRSSVSRLGDR